MIHGDNFPLFVSTPDWNDMRYFWRTQHRNITVFIQKDGTEMTEFNPVYSVEDALREVIEGRAVLRVREDFNWHIRKRKREHREALKLAKKRKPQP